MLKSLIQKLPHLRELLKDNERNKNFVIQFQDLIFDYTHEKIDQETLKALIALYNENKVPQKFEAMFKGDKINNTENRSVLHTLLREQDNSKINKDVSLVLEKIKNFSNEIRNGNKKGASGKKIKNFISIGIGGSYLGAEFIYEALKSHSEYEQYAKGLNLKFLANICPIDFKRATKDLDPEETLIIIISKTFTTKETMNNAESARDWLVKNYSSNFDRTEVLRKHLCAVSTNLEDTSKFGIESDNVFGFWDWVGGRYSVWSAVGALPLSLIFGYDVFSEFLRGGNSIDKHLMDNINNPEKNIPVLLGLLGYYNSREQNISSRAILPYSQALCRFPAHVQQLDMESNGKQVSNITNTGEFLTEVTGPIVFGEPGTNGQHSFYQLIHQGRDVACEFIGFAKSQSDYKLDSQKISNHEELMCNFFAQPDALALGKFGDELKDVKEELKKHKTFKGDKQSVSLLFKELNAYTCGQLLSLYEHRVATEGFMYKINSFDQFGVELGKVNAGEVRNILGAVKENKNIDELTKSMNSASASLIKKFVEMHNA